MLLSVTSRILSKTEIAFLSGSREFTKPQARCIRCRLNKKLKMLNVELAELENNFGLRNRRSRDRSSAGPFFFLFFVEMTS
jgi:hypothetical protein